MTQLGTDVYQRDNQLFTSSGFLSQPTSEIIPGSDSGASFDEDDSACYASNTSNNTLFRSHAQWTGQAGGSPVLAPALIAALEIQESSHLHLPPQGLHEGEVNMQMGAHIQPEVQMPRPLLQRPPGLPFGSSEEVQMPLGRLQTPPLE